MGSVMCRWGRPWVELALLLAGVETGALAPLLVCAVGSGLRSALRMGTRTAIRGCNLPAREIYVSMQFLFCFLLSPWLLLRHVMRRVETLRER